MEVDILIPAAGQNGGGLSMVQVEGRVDGEGPYWIRRDKAGVGGELVLAVLAVLGQMRGESIDREAASVVGGEDTRAVPGELGVGDAADCFAVGSWVLAGGRGACDAPGRAQTHGRGPARSALHCICCTHHGCSGERGHSCCSAASAVGLAAVWSHGR